MRKRSISWVWSYNVPSLDPNRALITFYENRFSIHISRSPFFAFGFAFARSVRRETDERRDSTQRPTCSHLFSHCRCRLSPPTRVALPSGILSGIHPFESCFGDGMLRIRVLSSSATVCGCVRPPSFLLLLLLATRLFWRCARACTLARSLARSTKQAAAASRPTVLVGATAEH